MREVVWKDLVLHRNTLLANALIFAATFGLLGTMADDSPRALAVFAGLMVAFAPVGIVTREDKARAMALSCSLPVTRRTIVRARYALGLALVIPGVLASLGVAAVVPTSLALGELFRPSMLLLAYSVALLVLALMFPLTLCLGAMGLIVLIAGFQVLGVVLLTLTQLTHSNADKRILGAIVRFFTDAAATLGSPGFHVAAVAVLAAVLALSYRLSVFLFGFRPRSGFDRAGSGATSSGPAASRRQLNPSERGQGVQSRREQLVHNLAEEQRRHAALEREQTPAPARARVPLLRERVASDGKPPSGPAPEAQRTGTVRDYKLEPALLPRT